MKRKLMEILVDIGIILSVGYLILFGLVTIGIL